VLYLSLIVLIPLAAVATRSLDEGLGAFWDEVTGPQAVAALRLTTLLSGAAVLVNGVMGTVIAWVLVRDDFRGKGVMDVLIDLPFALPTIVAGLTLLAIYGPRGPLGVNIAFTTAGIVLALILATLPFTVRAVQPVLMALDRDMEEAAASLGAGRAAIFVRIVLPNLVPAIVSGVGLSFAKALGEFGAVVLIAGNIPYETEVASVFIFGQIENDDVQAAAAVSVVLLVASLVVLVLLGLVERRLTRHAR
jgi:sulfate transport system permease protein